MELKELEIKSDHRGSLVEAFKLPTDGQLFYVISKPGETRGNHYHLRKTENFLVIWGAAIIQVKDRATGTVVKLECNGNRPILARIVPNHIHNITADTGGCIFLVWVDEQFNPDDADTYPEEI